MEHYKQLNPLLHEMKAKSALRDRRVFISGLIDEDLAFEVNYFLNRIKDLDEQSGSEKLPITLVINSYGGSVIWGNSIIGLLEHLKSIGYKIIGLVQGFAFSMAFDILVCCDERLGYEFSEYMIHQTQIGKYEMTDLIDYERDIEFSKKEWDKSVKYYLKYTKFTKEEIEDLYKCRKNLFLLSEEALKYGVIDKII